MCVFVLHTGPVRVTRIQLVLYCFLLSLIICKCTEEFVVIYSYYYSYTRTLNAHRKISLWHSKCKIEPCGLNSMLSRSRPVHEGLLFAFSLHCETIFNVQSLL